MKLERAARLPKEEFLRDFLIANRPLVIVDATEHWNSAPVWTEEFFLRHFGQSSVQVYDDLFTLETVMTLRDYFTRYWYGSAAPDGRIPYVRWYTKFKAVDFVWADDAFISLAPHWSLPYFLPDSQYLLPYCPPDRTVTPVWHQFPGKGLFISGAGARTRLHKDPWASDAVLCQMYGEKRVLMYSPDKERALKVGGKVVDVEKPDLRVSSSFTSVEPDVDDVLRPGEVLFIPAGWLHHVNSLTNSISVTWNFVSIHRWASFLNYLLGPVNEDDRAVLRYFAQPQATVAVTESVG